MIFRRLCLRRSGVPAGNPRSRTHIHAPRSIASFIGAVLSSVGKVPSSFGALLSCLVSLGAVLFAMLVTLPASAQHPLALSDEAEVSLITILPGDAIYSLWGHSAIRVYDPATGFDRSFNYGTFSFETDWFVLKFMYGNLLYQLSVNDFQAALEHYARVEERSVIEQRLRLSPAQRDSVVAFLIRNYRPENRYYRYDFLFDNCSTRIRDVFEQILGDGLSWGDDWAPSATFRELLDPYHSAWPFLDAGIDWMLGRPADRPAQPRETMFLPDYLMAGFDRARVRLDGEFHPLVVTTDTLYWTGAESGSASAFPWAAVFGWMVFGAAVFVTVRSARTDRGPVRALDGPLFLIVGIAGLLIVFLWFISMHQVTDQNWHLMWSWPTHVIAGALLLRARPPSRLMRGYLFAAALLALVAALGSPLWPMDFHPALTPIMLTIALRGGWIFYGGVHRRERDAL